MNITDGSMRSRNASLAVRIDGVGPGRREIIQQEDGEATEQGGPFFQSRGTAVLSTVMALSPTVPPTDMEIFLIRLR